MNLLRALSTVSAMTLLSRVTGLARESLKAFVFGAGLQMDAFEAAFRLPNILRRLFAEGAFAQAFVPIIADCQRRNGDAATRELVGKVAGLLAVALIVVSVLGVLAAPWLVYLLASGFVRTPGKVELTAAMIRVMFPYILFISLVSLAGGVLNVYRRFAIPAFTPVLLNFSVIGAAIFLAPHVDPPIMALAWGVAIGGVAQLALQIRPLAKLGMLARPRLDWRDPGVRRVLSNMGPALLGVSAAQISVLINTQLAALLGDGRVSWLYYADRLMEFPTGLLGVALGTVLLPSLSRYHAASSDDEYSKLLDWGLRLTLVLTAPAAAALALLSVPLVTTLFHYGKFGEHDVWMTRQALIAYSAGLLGLILVKVLAPGFYARQNIATPVRIAVLTLIATQAMNAVFVLSLKQGGLELSTGIGPHAGLALAIGLGACLNAGLLYRKLRQHRIYQPQPGWGPFSLKIAAALAAMALALWLAMGPAAWWLSASGGTRVAAVAGLVVLGGATYFSGLWLLGFRLGDFARRAA